jgi:membrane dipeptidase
VNVPSVLFTAAVTAGMAAVAGSLAGAAGANDAGPSGAGPAASVRASAVYRVIDLHVDLASALYEHKHTIEAPTSPVHRDKLLKGGVELLVLPLFVPGAYASTPPHKANDSYEAVFVSLDRALRSSAAAEIFLRPGLPEQSGKVGTLLAFEGADGFADEPERIVPWIRKGACFVGLVHDHTNALSGSSTDPDAARRAVGLTERGRRLAEIVVRHGGVLDGAHGSEAAIDELVAIGKRLSAPVVVTHTGLRALRDLSRNVDDERLAAIASTGGVVGIDLHSGHLSSRRGLASVDDVVAHLEHAVRVAGIDHVAIGSDFDGGIRPPREADGAAFWPILAERLETRGWASHWVDSVLRANAARVIAWARLHGCGSAVEP